MAARVSEVQAELDGLQASVDEAVETPVANPADCSGGIVLAGGGSAKEEFFALIALE